MKPVFLIIWEDSESSGSWENEEDWDKGLKFHLISSIGYLLKETEKGIALGTSWDDINKRGNPVLYIPHSCIISMTELDIK